MVSILLKNFYVIVGLAWIGLVALSPTALLLPREPAQKDGLRLDRN